MKSQLTNYDLMRLLRSWSRKYKLPIQEDCQRKWINFEEQGAKGKLTYYDFEDGVRMLLFNGVLPDQWELAFESKEESPFLMLFNVRGAMRFNYNGHDEGIELDPLESLLAAHPANRQQILALTDQGETLFLLLLLERHLYVHHIECLPEQVQAEASMIFSDETAIKEFVNSHYGLEGAALLQKILEDKNEGLVHATYVEAKVLELFSMQLKRWENANSGVQNKKTTIRPEDMERIILARNYLVENFQNAPTIETLAKKAGVNRQKLKQGFKIVFGKTVNEYLRGERLKLARQLLSQGSMSVKEVSTKVGYENSSYFARRFKKAYGLYPNEYLTATSGKSEEEE